MKDIKMNGDFCFCDPIDEHPEINIAFTYDDTEKKKVVDRVRKAIRKNKYVQEIADEVWKFNYGGRVMFINAYDEIFYPEQLFSIRQISEQMDVDVHDLFRLYTDHPISLNKTYSYYLNHRGEIDSSLYFI